VSDETTVPESQVIADIATAAARPTTLAPGALFHCVVPEGYVSELQDTEKWLPEPDRLRGTVVLHTAESLTEFINRHKDERTTVWADQESFRFISVLNDATKGCPEWADHRAALTMRKTPEWAYWESKDGELMSQEDFAGHIEDGQTEVREPDAATLLELASTFHAKTGVNFRQSTRLQDGQRQLQYDETTTATAGHSGQILIPREFILGIAPFFGSDPYKVVARLRFRLNGGKLGIGYQLVRPHEVQQAAFQDAAASISGATEVSQFMGTPVTGVAR
jgi:uncharacterized protein YfdQ (DUF2303 family)